MKRSFEEFAFLFAKEGRVGVPEGLKGRGLCRLNYEEARLLFDIVAEHSTGDFLELGRYKGGSTILIKNAMGNRESRDELVSIDIRPLNDNEVERHLEDVPLVHELKIQNSTIPVDREFGGIFVDGDHSFKGVVSDLLAHFNSLDTGGSIVFHDAVENIGNMGWSGVVDVVNTMSERGYIEIRDSADSLVVGCKLRGLSKSVFVEECFDAWRGADNVV